jgi:hypothetical protein
MGHRLTLLFGRAISRRFAGKVIAKRTGYAYTTIRRELPDMVNRGLLTHGPKGYRRA